MFDLDSGRPNDRRGFLHKTLGSIAKGIIGTTVGVAKIGFRASPAGQALAAAQQALVQPSIFPQFRPGPQGFALAPPGQVPQFGPTRQTSRSFGRGTVPRTQTARVSLASASEKEMGRSAKFNGGGGAAGDGCIFPARRDPGTGRCKIFLGERAGPNGGAPVGDAVMGRFGAALEPGIQTIDRAVCLPGMQLGKDGLCYNKGAITNKERMWPAGRKPLLSGGEMRAISIAARAGSRLEKTTKRLQKLGMMKKSTIRSRGAARIAAQAERHHAT